MSILLNALKNVTINEVAAFGGIALNFVLNILNIVRTNKLRTQTLRLDEFKRLRPAVDSAYTEIRAHRNTLKSLEASGGGVTKVRKEVAECNKALVQTYNALLDALADLDISQHVSGSDWCSCVSDCWDEILRAFDSAYVREKDIVATKDAIRKIISKIDNLLLAVHSRLDSEIS